MLGQVAPLVQDLAIKWLTDNQNVTRIWRVGSRKLHYKLGQLRSAVYMLSTA